MSDDTDRIRAIAATLECGPLGLLCPDLAKWLHELLELRSQRALLEMATLWQQRTARSELEGVPATALWDMVETINSRRNSQC